MPDYRYVSQMSHNRWRATVNRHHVGMYTTAEDAALAADLYIVRHLETDIAALGRYPLNFPDKQDPIEVRALHLLAKSGWLPEWTAAQLVENSGPEEPEEVYAFSDESDLQPLEVLQECRAWFVEQDKKYEGDFYSVLGEKYRHTPELMQEYPSFKLLYQGVKTGDIDVRSYFE